MHYVNSSAIRAVDWDERTLHLNIIFVGGSAVYTYYGVPRWKYEGLLSASSKGTYFNDHIRDQHSCSH